MKFRTVVLALAATAMAGSALAHHSHAVFDRTKPVTFQGTVKELQWTNPHTWLQVMVPDARTGRDVEWSFEGGAVRQMANKGWSRDVVKPGDKITVVGYARRDGQPGAGLVSITTADGKTLN